MPWTSFQMRRSIEYFQIVSPLSLLVLFEKQKR